VVNVSTDAVTRDRQGGSNDRASARRKAAASQELEYAARISLDRTHMQVEDKLVKVGPGMEVTAEVKTGAQDHQLRLSPLARYKRESLRER